jgi:hypothetical protein
LRKGFLLAVNVTAVLTDIDAALALFAKASTARRQSDFSDLDRTEVGKTITTLVSVIERFAPPDSAFVTNTREILRKYGPENSYTIPYLAGNVQALRSAYEAGALGRVSQLVRAEVFGDFLEMAEYLLDEGYKDAAVVMVGSVLEEHLRKLCDARGLPTELNGRPKKADALNAELVAAGAYNKLDQKNVTAWLDLRNKAAHGKYAEYSLEQAKNMLAGVRIFMTQTL